LCTDSTALTTLPDETLLAGSHVDGGELSFVKSLKQANKILIFHELEI
jgi:hypothetical protein